MRLAVIAVFLNEEEFLPSFLASLATQQREADLLLLVDDGSSDRSLELAREFADGRERTRTLSRPRRPSERDRLATAAELKAFSWAVEQIDIDWEVVAKLDADLRLPPSTFAELERRLDADPQLGIVGAQLSLLRPDGRLEREHSPPGHVRGATTFYRRACFEQIYPLAPRLGWDTQDELRARMHGWRTESFPLSGGDVVHLREAGTAQGALRGYRRAGIATYAYGAGPLWALLGTLRRLGGRPRVLGGISFLWGWSLAALRSDPRASAEERAFLARERRGGVRRWLLRPVLPADAAAEPAASASRRAPSTADIPLVEKLRESVTLLRSHASDRGLGHDFAWIFDDIESYDRLLRENAGVSLSRATALEIGFGARPFRLLALLAAGVDAEGIDAEVPILRGSAREFVAAYSSNGPERALKSLVRHVLYDRGERRAFAAALAARGLATPDAPSRFHVVDVADFDPQRRYDLIFSEDVFEHIPRKTLTPLMGRMAAWLAPGGIALIRPNVFTGITGGHALDWRRDSFRKPARRTVEAWDHLRAGRHRPNTYLNQLTRQDYRDLFSSAFTIIDEEVGLPDLGREFLTGAAARDLASWPEEELFSNQVRWVLRPRH